MTDYRELFNLTGRTALVVGAGSGIGAACAHGLAAFGARVVAADVNLPNAQKVAAEITAEGGQAQAVALDMRDAASIAAALAGLGPVDVLVSTPSINVRKPLLEISDDKRRGFPRCPWRAPYARSRAASHPALRNGSAACCGQSEMRRAQSPA